MRIGGLEQKARTVGCRAAAAFFVAAALGFAGSSAADEIAGQQNVAAEIGDLEKAFWVCDWAATTSRIDDQQAIVCGKITTELTEQKFGGDFDKLVAWWRENKVSEHRKLTLARNQAS